MALPPLGPFGFSTSSTQRNTDTFNFLLNDGQGGGSASTLQSPATILPDGTGTAQLTINSTGFTTSSLNVTSALGISVIGVNGDVQSSVGLGNTPTVWLAKLQGDGLLRVGLNENGSNPVMTVDATNNTVNLCAPVGGGSVVANAPLTIQDQTQTATGVVIQGEPPFVGVTGVSRIANNLAANGALQLGSSVAKPNVLTVSDIAGSASVTVGANGAGASDIQLTGGITGGAANITTTAGGTGQLSLGASSVNPQTLFIRDGATANSGYVEITGGTAGTSALQLRGFQTGGIPTISTNLNTGVATSLAITPGTNDATPAMVLSNDGAGNINIAVNQQMNIAKLPASAGAYTSQVLLPAGTAYSGSLSIDLTSLPSGWAMVYGFSAAPTTTDKNNMFSVMVFTGPTNVLQGGGVGGLAGSATCFPDPTNNTSLQVNFAGATSTGYSILGITLLGG